MINNKIKNKTYHAVGTIPKSNIKIADRGKTDTPNTYIYFIVHFIAVDWNKIYNYRAKERFDATIAVIQKV